MGRSGAPTTRRLAVAVVEQVAPVWAARLRRRQRARTGIRDRRELAKAERAMEQGRFDDAQDIFRGLIGRAAKAAPEVYLRLGEAQRQLGVPEVAEETLAVGAALHPYHLGLAMDWAQLATAMERWPEACGRWEAVLATFGDACPPKAHLRLAIAFRERGMLGVAAAVLERARARFPDAAEFAIEWAQLAMIERRWPEAVRRWEHVLERFEGQVPSKVHAWLAIAHREQGDLETAAVVLERALELHPGDVRLGVEQAHLAMVEQDFTEAISRFTDVLDRYEEQAPTKVFERLAIEHRHLGHFDEAEAVLKRGRVRFPDDIRLANAWAQAAMVRGDWAEALRRWDEVVALRLAQMDHPDVGVVELPVRATNLDWHETAWLELADAWVAGHLALDPPASPELHLALGRTLLSVAAHDRALAILELGQREDPSDQRIAVTVELAQALSRRPDAALLAPLRVALSGFSPPPPDDDGTLGPIHRLEIPLGSSIERAVRAGGTLFDERRIAEEIRDVSRAQAWPELAPGPNPLAQRARAVADAFGRRFEEQPYLPADALSDAVYFLIYSELAVHEPLRRLAEVVAEDVREDPVFIEQPSDQLSYLSGYGHSNFGPVYLYFELRSRGVNAFLCRFTVADPDRSEGGGGSGRRISVAPAASLMQARRVEQPTTELRHARALIPAGIRSIPHVVEATDSLLYASGFITQQFAYDRSLRRFVSIEPAASVHPPRSLLPIVSFDLWEAGTLESVVPAADGMVPVTAPIQVAASVGGDWLGWLDHVLHDYLADLSRRCQAEVSLRGIEEVHVADHLFVEPAMFSAAVLRAGGRVVLWPHSANPAHAEVRRPGTFHRVHAVTTMGCRQWSERFPDAEVVQAAEQMLAPRKADAPVRDGAPLSVVVLGGKTTIGLMPFLDEELHERAYRSFFAGLERLQQDHPIEVFFKSKGIWGENEAWLQRVVGGTAGWQRVLEHPLRLELPNMLFVSVSMGTSGLLEGISRGIPCAIVREFPIRDYTTISPGAVPIGPVEEVLDVLRACADPRGRAALLERQSSYYDEETGPAFVEASPDLS